MDKTVTVMVIRRVRDRRFHKFLTNRVKYHVHDEENTGKGGVVIPNMRASGLQKRGRVSNLHATAPEARLG